MSYAHYLFLLLVIILSSHAHATEITFTRWDLCEYGCDFNNGTLWEGGIAPGENDTAIIVHNVSTNSIVSVYVQTTILNLQIVNVTLEVLANASLATAAISSEHAKVNVEGLVTTCGNVTFSLDSLLNISKGNFQSKCANAFWYLDQASTLLVDNAIFSIRTSSADTQFYGNILVTAAYSQFIVMGTLVTLAPSSSNLLSLVEFGKLLIPSGYNIHAHGGLHVGTLNISSNSNLTSYHFFSLLAPGNGEVYFADSTSTLTLTEIDDISGNGWFTYAGGQGTLNIIDSTVIITASTADISQASLSFFGANDVTFNEVVLGSNLYFAPDSYISILANDLHFEYNVSIPGDVFVNQSSLILDGFTELKGCIYGAAAAITINNGIKCNSGVLSFKEEYVWQQKAIVGSNVIIGVAATVPSLLLDGASQLNLFSDVSFQGNFYNNGTLQIVAGKKLAILGNYTQTSNGLFIIDRFTQGDFPAIILVNGLTSLNGSVEYISSGAFTKSFSRVIIESSTNITGNFTQLSGKLSDLKIVYSPTEVILEYTYSGPSKYAGLEWYYWLIIGVGVLLIIIVSITLIVRYKRRATYAPVSSLE